MGTEAHSNILLFALLLQLQMLLLLLQLLVLLALLQLLLLWLLLLPSLLVLLLVLDCQPHRPVGRRILLCASCASLFFPRWASTISLVGFFSSYVCYLCQ